METAALLFRRQGYAATGVNQILETAGVKAGSMYHHFPNGKQELAAAVVDAVGGGIEQQLRGFLADETPVADIVDGWIDLLAAALAGDQRDGCPSNPSPPSRCTPARRCARRRRRSSTAGGVRWPTGCAPTGGLMSRPTRLR